MQRILLPTPDAPPARGGVARYIGALLRVRSDVELETLFAHWGTFQVFSFLFRKVIRGQEIWTHHIFPVGTVCYVLSFLKKTPYVVFLHGLDFDLARRNIWKRFLSRKILLRAKKIVVNSNALCEEVTAFCGRADVFVLHPCVDQRFVIASETLRKGLAHYSPKDLAHMFVSQMIGGAGIGVAVAKKPKEHAVRLLTVARLVERKGHRKVLYALQNIPDATYTIVGDGPEREALQKEAFALGVADRVTFLLAVSDEQLPEIYTSHDIFVMPTTKTAQDREGFGIVYAEAGLFGLPCIATRAPGVDEAIVHDVTGLLIEDSPRALCDALQTLVHSPGLRSRLGSAARLYVLEHFAERVFAKRIRRL